MRVNIPMGILMVTWWGIASFICKIRGHKWSEPFKLYELYKLEEYRYLDEHMCDRCGKVETFVRKL